MRLFSLLLLCGSYLLAQPPIVFVHGNGDDSAKWIGIVWLFESNGYPADRLRPIRFTHPSARTDDGKPEANRSSSTDQAAELAAFVARTLIETNSKQVVLIGSSRGGNAIRNYIKFGGGAANVSHAILCGTPNHGVFKIETLPGNEFNGIGPFLKKLNEGSEVAPGVKFLTIRSDKFDKYAQPNGTGYESPMLAGAENAVIPNADHREVAFDPRAFRLMYQFILGQPPAREWPTPEAAPRIGGLVTGFANGAANNLPEAGVHLRVWKLDPVTAQREEKPALDVTTAADGAWGPLVADSTAHYEFELSRDGKTIRYFKSPLLRSTRELNLRWVPAPAKPGEVIIARPQGYFARGRDAVLVNGEPASEVPDGLPNLDRFTLTRPGAATLRVELRKETIVARPSEANATSIVDLLWD